MTDDRLVDDRPIGTDLARALYDLLTGKFELRNGDRVVIGIGGESGSGKSSAATSLARELRESGVRTCVINSDDYFHLPPRTNHEQRLRSLRHVGPHEVNLPLVEQHIRDFRAARNNVIAPQVNYPADRFDAQRHDFDTFQALIVEGTYERTTPHRHLRGFV